MIVQCAICGAPIEVEPTDPFARCSYCGESERLANLFTLHHRTPAGWTMPPTWMPPPGLRVKGPLTYHPPLSRMGGGGRGVVITRSGAFPAGCIAGVGVLIAAIGGAVALLGSGGLSHLLPGGGADDPPALGAIVIGGAPVRQVLHGTTHGDRERDGEFGEYDAAPTVLLVVTRRSLVTLRTHSTDDTTLYARVANGAEPSDDDGGEGIDAQLRLPLEPGRYPVWVGHRSEGVPFELGIDAFAVNELPGADGLVAAGPPVVAEVTLDPSGAPLHWPVTLSGTFESNYCSASIGALPTVLLHSPEPRTVRIEGHADDAVGGDAVLVVRDATGHVACDDDSGGDRNARIDATLLPGVTAIWLGALHPTGGSVVGTLSVLAIGAGPRATGFDPGTPATEGTIDLDALGRNADDVVVRGHVDGYLDAAVLSNACTGRLAAAPTISLQTSRPRHVVVRAHDATDLVLASRGPSGGVVCNDDAEGSDPRLDLRLAAGETDVWVGPYHEGDVTFALTIQP